jgi:nucleotide-binding universal stress UspA family protein
MNHYSIQKILVPVDLSETSLNALNTAVALAKKHNAVVQILNVREQLPSRHNNLYYPPSAKSANTDVLSALTGAIRDSNNEKPELIQETGNVVDLVIQTANTEKSDLVVIGSHGASGFREGFMGSNAYGVIKYASCPVLTIPPVKKYTGFKRVLFPIRPVSGALMRYGIACNFLSMHATMQVLGLSYLKLERETSVLDKIVEEIKEQLEEDKIIANTYWGRGNSFVDDILYFAQMNNPELIILTSNIDAVTKPNFIGPHAQKLLHCSRVPILSSLGVPVPAQGLKV